MGLALEPHPVRMPKKPKQKKASAADKKALNAAVAVPFDAACQLHTQAENEPPARRPALLESALGKYEEALALKPQDLDTLFNMGTALLLWAEALPPTSAQAGELRGRACQRWQDVVRADTSQRSETRANALSSLVGALCGGADLALANGNYAEAERIFGQVCAMESALPDDGMAWYNLGHAYQTMMDVVIEGDGSFQQQAGALGAQAVRCFKTGLTCPPSVDDPHLDVDLLCDLAAVHYALGQPIGGIYGDDSAQHASAAAAHCTAALTLDPNRGDARCTHAAACHIMAQQLPSDAAGVEAERWRLLQQAQTELSAAASGSGGGDKRSDRDATVAVIEYTFNVAELQMEHARLLMMLGMQQQPQQPEEQQQLKSTALAAWEAAVRIWTSAATAANAAVAEDAQWPKRLARALGWLSLAHYNRACALSMALGLLEPPAISPVVAMARESVQLAVAGWCFFFTTVRPYADRDRASSIRVLARSLASCWAHHCLLLRCDDSDGRGRRCRRGRCSLRRGATHRPRA